MPKALKKHALGHSEPGAQKHSKSTPWGTFWPGPLTTPVNGGRERNSGVYFSCVIRLGRISINVIHDISDVLVAIGSVYSESS